MEIAPNDITALLQTLRAQDYAVLQLPIAVAPRIDRTSVHEALQGRERWQPEFPEFENDTMGRSFLQNKVSWLDDGDDGLADICKELVELAEVVASITPDLGLPSSGRTRVMAHTASTDEDKKQLALPAQGIKVEASVLQDRLLFREQRKVCILHIVGGSDGTLTLHREGSDIPVKCQDGMTLVFRHDIFDYSFEPVKDQHALQVWLLRDSPAGAVARRDFDPKEAIKKIPAGPLYGSGNETVDVMAISVRDPGKIMGPEDYWAMLSGGCDTIVQVPLERWDLDLYYSAEADVEGKGYVQHFGMLNDTQMAMFDNQFFNMSAEEAKMLDPVQRNSLEVGYDCFYRSGWTCDSLRGVEMCASFGYAASEFVTNMAMRGAFGYTDQIYLQNNPSACASRLHFVFGMKGPVSTTETACSSSLSAVGLMHNNLRPVMPEQTKNMAAMRKQVKYGIAIGSNGHFDPLYTIALCGASMLSHVGRCFTFDQSADGFIRGEGCGAMAFRVSSKEDLARLAVLCGTCLNQDGRSASLTAPHGPSQQECIRSSLREAGIRSLDIQIQELHGTGTALGDPIEVGALRATMMKFEGQVRHHPLVKTSSKSNLGHTEMSAGINGLMKCVLMGCYAASAPNVHLRLLNPHIDDAAYPVYFTPEFVDQGKETGFFGVSSFGFGGSNARGDIWCRAQAGPRNTSHDDKMSFGCDRIYRCIDAFGSLTMPLPGVEPFETEHGDSTEGLSGEYTVGAKLQGKTEYFVVSSANGWSYGKMTWDASLKAHCYAIMMGEALREQFQISCDGFDDLKIFPAKRLADPEAIVLGPGAAPSGHTWLIDGRKDQAKPHTLYRITLQWSEELRRKRVFWEPVEASDLPIKVVRHSYYIVASWTAYKPFEMVAVRKGELYEATVRIGIQDMEEFQFMRDADVLQAIYPAEKGGGSAPVCGPDSEGSGKFWRIAGSTGESWTIRLEVGIHGISVVITGTRGQRRWSSKR